MDIETVTIFRTWIEIADALKCDAERGKLYHAICRYSLYGDEPHLEGLLQSYFTLMRPSIDKSNKRKIAQQNSSQMRLQNRLQNNLQNKQQERETESLQNNTRLEPQNSLQNESQNNAAHVRKTGTGTEKKREPSGSPKEAAASFADQIPEILKNPVFEAKWKEWEAFRKSIHKPISKFAAAAQFRILAKYPADTLEMIDFSIANDYQGIFPPKNRPKPQSRKDYNGI